MGLRVIFLPTKTEESQLLELALGKKRAQKQTFYPQGLWRDNACWVKIIKNEMDFIQIL